MTTLSPYVPDVFKVCVLENARSLRNGWIPCVVGKSGQIEFSPEALSSYCFAPWDPIIYDLLLVAAAVNFCDTSKKRPAACWTRSFELRIPVDDPARWSEPAVSSSLHRALRLLTGDNWNIQFIKRETSIPSPHQQSLPISPGSSAVIAFSNGLDSYSVANWHAAEYGNNTLIRVRVGRGDKTQPKKSRFTKIPFTVRPHGNSHETSGRSRGFKFAVASGLAAYLSDISEIIVPESGQGALGPTLVRYTGMHSDFRNHPRFFRLMEVFLEALLGRSIIFKLPRLANTKGESIQIYLKHDAVNSDTAVQGLMQTRSCWQDRHYVATGDGIKRQCGVCAACMLRRLSMHVAGVEEPENTYSWSDLNAPDLRAGAPDKYKDKIGPSLPKYAIAGTLHLTHLSRLRGQYDYADILNRHAVEIADAIGSDQKTVAKWLDELLQRHETQWRDFLGTLSANSFVKQWAGLP